MALSDREPHQHARDRHQDAGRYQDPRTRSSVLERVGGAHGFGRAHDRGHGVRVRRAHVWQLYLDFDVDREAAARFGLTVGDVEDVIQSAIGGKNVTTTVEGLERYPLNVRYARDFRDDVPALENVLVTSSIVGADGTALQVPLGTFAKIHITQGAPMIRSENAARTAWVFVDIQGRDLGGYIEEARRRIADEVRLPAGYTTVFSALRVLGEDDSPAGRGQQLALIAIVVLLYLSSASWFRVAIVMLAVPVQLDRRVLVPVRARLQPVARCGHWDDRTRRPRCRDGDGHAALSRQQLRSVSDRGSGSAADRELHAAVHDGAVRRIRPKAMTVAAAFIGLVPLLWAEGTGADTMRRIAAPMIGGLLISFAMELVVYPVVFFLAKRWQHRHEFRVGGHDLATEVLLDRAARRLRSVQFEPNRAVGLVHRDGERHKTGSSRAPGR